MSALTVFLTTYNTGLQGSLAQEQDLSSWLIPVLQTAAAENAGAPDLYAIAVQELLPLHLAMAGLSQPVLIALTQKIESLLSAHVTSLSPTRTQERYTLVSRVCHVGTALWVFARESTMQGRLGKTLRSSVGLWRLGMGNKAAVGVRVPVKRTKEGAWETLTFVSTHLEAHDKNIALRNEQYNTILSSLVFGGGDALQHPVAAYESSHLFIMGDLNYRLERLPGGVLPQENSPGADVVALQKERVAMVAVDTLKREQRAGRAFGGMREGDLTHFAPTYKRIVGKVDGYSKKRIPGWTDRIFVASFTDPPQLYAPDAPPTAPETTTQILQFNSTPELTISDHKPVHAVLSLPPATHSAARPTLAPVLAPPPPPSRPRPRLRTQEDLFFWSVVGTILDRLVGWPWTLMVLLGFGNEKTGMGVSAFFAMVWGVWWSGLVQGYFSA